MGALGCAECNKQAENNTRMRPTHGRSRLWGCVSMFCFHPLQCRFLFSTNQRLDEFAVVVFERLDLPQLSFLRRRHCACFVLHFRNAGAFKTKGRATSKPVRFVFRYIQQNLRCQPRPRISESLSINRQNRRS